MLFDLSIITIIFLGVVLVAYRSADALSADAVLMDATTLVFIYRVLLEEEEEEERTPVCRV